VQQLLPAFEKEGITDGAVCALALVDLKALGLSTMAQAMDFKTCVAELLLAEDGQVIEKPPHSAVESEAAASAAEASAPPLDLADIAQQQRSQQSQHEFSNIPVEFTDQYATCHTSRIPFFAQALCNFTNSASIRYFTMELLRDPVVAADGFTYISTALTP
jgi:hypothetical protein